MEFPTFTYAHTILFTNKTRELIAERERELSKKEKMKKEKRKRVRETNQTVITDLDGGGLELKMVTTV